MKPKISGIPEYRPARGISHSQQNGKKTLQRRIQGAGHRSGETGKASPRGGAAREREIPGDQHTEQLRFGNSGLNQ